MIATVDELTRFAKICTKGICGERCPYYERENCVETMMTDALAYIEQLENRAEPKNRVLTLEEVVRSDAMWYEDRTMQGTRVVILGYAQNEPGFTKLINYLGDKFYRRDDAYNDFWRCWLRKPTEAERRETPWKS